MPCMGGGLIFLAFENVRFLCYRKCFNFYVFLQQFDSDM